MDSKLTTRSPAGRGTLAATILASGMAFLDATVVNVALSRLGENLGATIAELQWVVNGYMLTLAAFVLLGGALGDRLGRRRVFIVGAVWFAVASLACGLAPGIGMLIAARILQGVGAALLTPASLALVQASFSPEERGRAIGAWAGLSGVTSAIGPFVGGVLIDHLSWRWIFLINLPMAGAIVWLARRHVPESAGTAGRFDVLGACLGALFLGALSYGLTARNWIAIVAAMLALAGFVWAEKARGAQAMMPLHLFASRVFTTLNIYTAVVYAAFGGFLFLLVIFLQNVWGYSALQAGLATLPITLLLLGFSPYSGALATRIGPRPQLVAGPLVCAAGAVWLHQAGPNYWMSVFPGILIFSIGWVLQVAPLTTAVLAALADRHAGVASGINLAAARAGALIAVAALPLMVGLAGVEYTQPGPLTSAYRAGMLWCAAFLALGGLMALTLPRPAGSLRNA